MNRAENIDEIYILNHKLEIICTINNFTKFEYTEKMYEADSFSIEMPFERITNTRTSEYSYYKSIYSALTSGNIEGKDYLPRFITTNDKGLTNIGYIENYTFKEDGKLEIKGEGFIKFFEKRKTIAKKYIPNSSTSDTCGEVMCRIINDNNSKGTNFAPYFEAIEKDNVNGEDIYVECESKDNVYKKLTTIAKAYEVGISTLYDNDNHKIIFKTFKYSDREEDIKIALSEDDDNVESIEYEVDNGKHYNYVIVEGENVNGIVDLRVDKENSPALEIVHKSNKKRGDTSLEDYIKILEGEGREFLATKKIEEQFNIIPNSNVECELGKYVVCKIDLGYEVFFKKIPITEITHTIEKDVYSRSVGFGDIYNLRDELKFSIE